MKFADELKLNRDNKYVEWVKKNENAIKDYTKRMIEWRGEAKAYCHGYCQKTQFGCMASVLPSDKDLFVRWLNENGFKHYDTFNGYGSRMIVWYV